MKRVGELLKKERERQNISLHEIGMSLKINPKTLQALEEGDESRLPAKTFLRGFVRSYAQFLKLNVDEITKIFQEEVGSTRPEPIIQKTSESSLQEEVPTVAKGASVIELKRPTPAPTQPSNKSPGRHESALPQVSETRVWGIIGGTILLVLIVIVAKLVDKYQKERVVGEITATPIETAPAPSHPPISTPSAPMIPLVLESPLSTPPVPPPVTLAPSTPSQPLPSTKSTKVDEPIKAAAPVPTPPPPPPAKTVAPAKPPPPAPTPAPAPAPSKPTEIIVEAFNKIQIRYNLGDGRWQNLELAADQIHTFKSTKTVQMEISDGGAVNVIVNGRDRGVPGTIGKSIKLSYP